MGWFTKNGKHINPDNRSHGIRSTDFEDDMSNSVSVADLEQFAKEKVDYYEGITSGNILPESREIWESNSVKIRNKMLGNTNETDKLASVSWNELPNKFKVKFSNSIEEHSRI